MLTWKLQDRIHLDERTRCSGGAKTGLRALWSHCYLRSCMAHSTSSSDAKRKSTAHAINLCVNGKQLPLRSDTLLSGICHHVWPPRTARGQWLLSAGQRPANIAARWAHAGPTGPLCHEKHLPPAAWRSEAAMPDLTRHWGRQGMLAAIPLMALPALHTCLVSNAGHTVDLC